MAVHGKGGGYRADMEIIVLAGVPDLALVHIRVKDLVSFVLSLKNTGIIQIYLFLRCICND